MTFSAIVTAETLKEWLAPVSAIVDECKLHLNPGGLDVKAVDPANVAMVDTTLTAGAFESYESDGGTIGIDLSQFEDVIGFADSSDLVFLELNEEVRKLDVEVGHLDYTFALINPQSIRQEPDIPDLDLAADIVVEGQDLGLMAEASDMVSDHITLGVDAQRGVFYSDAEGDTDDARIELDVNDGDVIDLGAAESVSSLFSLDYVTDLTGKIPDEAEVTVELGSEFPTKWHWTHADGEASVTTMVAPRIQGGDD